MVKRALIKTKMMLEEMLKYWYIDGGGGSGELTGARLIF